MARIQKDLRGLLKTWYPSLVQQLFDFVLEAIQLDSEALVDLGFTPDQVNMAQGRLMKGGGCRTCNGTGYKGRVALYEVMRFTDNLKEMVLQGSSTAELKMAAIKAGMVSLRMSGILKVLDGVTTTEEILRVTMAD